MTPDLIDAANALDASRERLAPGAMVLRGFALADVPLVYAALEAVIEQAPLRHMTTPGGFRMSVATTNCGALGWVTDATGYRYDARDPLSGRDWPAIPAAWRDLARRAAAEAGFDSFEPDACLVNCYAPRARLSPHQDRNERDFRAPIVSVSLGVPAVFQFGGDRRNEPMQRVRLAHGDVAVWGGASRMRYHGVLALAHASHALTGSLRYNLTFRKAG